MIPSKYLDLATGASDPAAHSAACQMMADLWKNYDSDDFTFMASRRGGHWRDHPIQGKDRRAQAAEILAVHDPLQFDIYFCLNAFSKGHRRAELALPTRYSWCDIDEADPAAYDPRPNLLWETSPGRFQGIWTWQTKASARLAEQYSKTLVYRDGGDRTGWNITKVLRLPGTINHKSDYNEPVVTLREYDTEPRELPASLAAIPEPVNKPCVPNSGPGSGDDRETIMHRYRREMGLPAGEFMTAKRVLRADRSGVVFQIVVGMLDAGAPDADIITVLVGNPYFVDKWGADQVRAEQEVDRIRRRLADRP